jgi:putative hydrolase of the HAD superfamily
MSEYITADRLEQELLQTEKNNINLYGFGIKSFTLSMIETALRVTNNRIDSDKIKLILYAGKKLINSPLVLFDHVENVLCDLYHDFKLIVATKGDLLDQERKLNASGLKKYFHHIEIMSDKQEENYKQLLDHLEIQPYEFVMIGNSLKSDILPVINIGGHSIYIPHDFTWQFEKVNEEQLHGLNYHTVNSILDVKTIIFNNVQD